MAESSLSIGVADLREEVGFFLGYGSASGSWSAAQLAEINKVVKSGVRRVYYPPAVSPETTGYEWSFLRPWTTLALVADDYDYDLPDDFGRLLGQFHYDKEIYLPSIPEISVAQLLELRANSYVSGDPEFCAVRYKSSDGSAGQRHEVLFSPVPNTDRTLHYQYEAYQGELTDDYPYPLGGMQLAELYIESCLAVAEQRPNDAPGLHSQMFERLLIDAVMRDRKRDGGYFGQMGDAYVTEDATWRRGQKLRDGTYEITYGGGYL